MLSQDLQFDSIAGRLVQHPYLYIRRAADRFTVQIKNEVTLFHSGLFGSTFRDQTTLHAHPFALIQ